MKVALWIIGVIAAIVAIAWIAGSLLPREHRAASSISLPQPQDSVWEVVRNLAALKGTWSELTEVRRVEDGAGREVWEEKVGGFDMRLVVVESTPPSRLVTQVDSAPGAMFGGRWVYELAPSASGTTITVAEEGWVDNPLFRLMSKLGRQHRSLDGYLTALGQYFGETVQPVHRRGVRRVIPSASEG